MWFLLIFKLLCEDKSVLVLGKAFPPVTQMIAFPTRNRRQKVPHSCGCILKTHRYSSQSEVEWDCLNKALLCGWCLLVSKGLDRETVAKKQWAEEKEKMQWEGSKLKFTKDWKTQETWSPIEFARLNKCRTQRFSWRCTQLLALLITNNGLQDLDHI